MIEQDLVVLRVWKDGGDVLALFPEQPADFRGDFCNSYAHMGQHSGADYHGCIIVTRPATPEESAPLLAELRQRGYNPRVIRRASRRHHDKRRQAARAV